MAIIEKLHILQFRNLDNQYLEPNTNTNLFIGGNGQGKTNLIEALYYLGHNRSFKSKNIKDVVPFEKEFLQIDAVVDSVRVLLKKSKNKSTILFNQKKIYSNSELTLFDANTNNFTRPWFCCWRPTKTKKILP